MAGTRQHTTIKVPAELSVGGGVVESSQVVRWLRDLVAYKRSFEQVYWMAERYAKSRGDGSAASIVYGEALERAKSVGFQDLSEDVTPATQNGQDLQIPSNGHPKK